MSVTLDLPGDLQTRAEAAASAQGLPLEQYLQSLVEQALGWPASRRQRVSPEEFEAIMDELTEGSELGPVPEVLTRAEIYGEHD